MSSAARDSATLPTDHAAAPGGGQPRAADPAPSAAAPREVSVEVPARESWGEKYDRRAPALGDAETSDDRTPGLLLSALSSLTVHLVLLIVLGAWLTAIDGGPRSLTIVTSFLSDEDALDPGEIEQLPVLFESPVENDSTDTEAVVDDLFADLAEQKEVQVDLTAVSAAGSLEQAPLDLDALGLRVPMFAGRQEGVRGELVSRYGGSVASEQAVARGLKWLADHQNSNGSWSLSRYHRAGRCRGRCRGPGIQSDTAGTAMALLPFLGAGQTHTFGDYQPLVRGGLMWLLQAQRSDGDLRGPGKGKMYAHAQATIVLCEALAMTGDPMLKEPAQRAVDFIVEAQHSAGGWRYAPGEPGDTSVHGWQVMALRSAQMAYLQVPSETLELASRYLDTAQTTSTGGLYSYKPDGLSSRSMTAEGLLCRQYLGWEHDHPGMVEGTSALEAELPQSDSIDIYYWYYATQTMHHYGGQKWETWNRAMRDLLISLQSEEGHALGSWDPVGKFGVDVRAGGRIYMTSLALCTLEVYYRHMPLYQAAAAH